MHCSICKIHIVKKSEIECLRCHEKLSVPDAGFPANLRAKAIIESGQHLSEQQKILQSKADAQALIIAKTLNQIQADKEKSLLASDNYFNDLTQKISKRNIILKEELDKIAKKMYENVNQFKRDFNMKLKLFNCSQFENLINENNYLKDSFLEPNKISLEEVEELESKMDYKILQLKEELINFNNLENSLKEFEFKCGLKLEDRHFGFLKAPIRKDILISCSLDKTIKIWDLETYSCIKTFVGHEEG